MRALLNAAAMTAALLTAAPASAAILGFDDITTELDGGMPVGYGGLRWNNFYILHRDYNPGTGYERGIISGDYTTYNGYGDPASIAALSGSFSFDGGWFTSAWEDDNLLTIEGFTDDDAIADYSLTLALSTQTPLFLDVHWAGLQSLRFTSSHEHFVLDDLRINEGAAAEVPEPLTIGLFGMGLLGIAGARRRKG